jgi:Protein of unknown function (DUF4242)
VVSGISRSCTAGHDRDVTYLIELYVPRGARIATERLTVAAARIRHLQTILVPADEIGYCLVEAPSAAALAERAETVGLKPERIVEVLADAEDGCA